MRRRKIYSRANAIQEVDSERDRLGNGVGVGAENQSRTLKRSRTPFGASFACLAPDSARKAQREGEKGEGKRGGNGAMYRGRGRGRRHVVTGGQGKVRRKVNCGQAR